jgi:signal transduction histidine kinase
MPDGGFVTTYTDITPQKQSARLEASNEAKSRFLENMSHDLRKPIAAVIEDARVLAADGMDLPPTSRSVLQSIEGNATHLLGMVDELLEMARIEAGQVRVKPEPVPLASLVDGARRVVERLATAKGLSVATEVDRRLTLVSDPRLLTRVVVNLLSNAVEYTARGSVSVHASQGDGKIALHVTDTGPGISRADQELIFGKFQRLQSTAGVTKPGVGLGLGLPISREFARLLGGDLTLQSEVGRGSTFILTLPLEYQQTS